MKIRLPWGETELEVELPADWRVIAEAQPKPFPACPSLAEEFARAMADPVGSAPLATRSLGRKKIVLVVDDLTRPTPAHLFFPYLLRELERAGADRRDLLLLTALGVHRPLSEQELRQKVGREGLQGLRWQNHDAREAEQLALLGETRGGTPVYVNRHLVEANLIVSVGSIEPHVLAGFGGGLKNLVPGCAGTVTIGKNHLQGTATGEIAQIGVDPERNPLRRDLEEAAGLLRKEIFLVNTVLNPQKEIVRVFSGDPLLAHRAGIKLAREIYGVPVPAAADILISDSSPMDTDLRQGAKCIGNLLGAVKKGGTILAFLRCQEGLGDFKLSGRSLPRPVMKALLRVMSRKGTLKFLDYARHDLEVEEKFLAFYSLEIMRRNEVLAYAPTLRPEEIRQLGIFRVLGDPQDLVRQAAARAPKSPTVAIFPRGGVTYPIVGAPAPTGPGT